ncbi:MAG: efflux RND transporter periplasmic adaptor subunit [Janthinobacterium lividum]
MTPYRITYFEFFDKFKIIGQGKFYQSKSYTANIDGKIDFSLPIAGKVTKGQVIVEIDRNAAAANKVKSESAYKTAQFANIRNETLFKKLFISKEALDASKLKLYSASVDLTRAINDYENSIIIAPFDGEIGVIKAKAGHNVHRGDFLFSIINRDKMIATFELPEILHGKVSTKTQVLLSDNNENQSLGEITSISPYLSDQGTFTVEVVTSQNNNFIHGSYLRGEFIINKHWGLATPERAILKNDKENFIYLIDLENVVRKKHIKIGTRTNNMVEIISQEIHDGNLIVFEGLTKVNDGTLVKLLD